MEDADLGPVVAVLMECFYKDALTLAADQFTEEEMVGGFEVWAKMDDPFAAAWELELEMAAQQMQGHTHDHDHHDHDHAHPLK